MELSDGGVLGTGYDGTQATKNKNRRYSWLGSLRLVKDASKSHDLFQDLATQPSLWEDLKHDMLVSKKLLPAFAMLSLAMGAISSFMNLVQHSTGLPHFLRDLISFGSTIILYIISYAMENRNLSLSLKVEAISYLAFFVSFLIAFTLLGSGILIPGAWECAYNPLWLTVFPFPVSFAVGMSFYAFAIYFKFAPWTEKVYICLFGLNNSFMAICLVMVYNVMSLRTSDPRLEFLLNGLVFPGICALVGRFLVVDFCTFISTEFLPGDKNHYVSTRLFYVFQVKVIFHYALQIALLDISEDSTFVLALVASNLSELFALVVNVRLIDQNPFFPKRSKQSSVVPAESNQVESTKSFLQNWGNSMTRDRELKLLAHFHGEEIAEKVNTVVATVSYFALEYFRTEELFPLRVLWRGAFLVLFEGMEDFFKRRLFFRLTKLSVSGLVPEITIREVFKFLGFVSVGYGALLISETIQKIEEECRKT